MITMAVDAPTALEPLGALIAANDCFQAKV